MKESAIDTINFLSSIILVKNSNLLTNVQKTILLRELKTSLPPEMLCNGFVNTRKIVEQIIDKEVANVEPKKAPKKTSAKAQEKHSSEEELLHRTSKNTRGSSTKKRVVN